MLRALLGGLGRWIFVVVFGLITCWPDFGIAALCWRFFPGAPLGVLAFACAWAVPLALVLPLSLNQFRIVSSAAIGGIYTVGAVSSYMAGYLDPVDQWWLGLVGFVFVACGWLTVCTNLWRWARGIVAVQDAEAAE